MRNLFIILGFIAAVLSVVLAVTPLSQIAYLPAIAALIFGCIAFYFSKRNNAPKKSVHLIFLLTTISLLLSTYKAVFNTAEVGNIEELELIEDASIKDSKELLEELDIDDIDLESDEPRVLEGMEDQ